MSNDRLDSYVEGNLDSSDSASCECDCELCRNVDEEKHCMRTSCAFNEWVDMPEFVQEDHETYRKIIVSFEKKEDVELFSIRLNQRISPKTRSIWFPDKPKNQTISRWIDES